MNATLLKSSVKNLLSSSLDSYRLYANISPLKKGLLGISIILTGVAIPGAAFALKLTTDPVSASNQSAISDATGNGSTASSSQSSDNKTSPKNDSSTSLETASATADQLNNASSSLNISLPPNSPDDSTHQSSVKINGRKVTVPDNGQISKTVPSANNKTEVDIKINENSSDKSSNSYTNIQINSSSTNSSSPSQEGGSRFAPHR